MLFLGFACVALLHLPIAHAVDNHNSTDIQSCKQELAPLNNNKGQSPCYVAKGLVAPCKENLEDGFEGGNSVCTCNTVLYNLVSACKLCYNGTESLLPAFDAWAVNCTPPNLVQMMNYYPLPEVSKSVHIPKWAYADLTADNSFDITAALRPTSRWSPVQISIIVIVPLALCVAFTAFLLYRRKRKRGRRHRPAWPWTRARQVRHARRAQGWDLDGSAQVSANTRNDPETAEDSPMIPNRFVFSTSSMTSEMLHSDHRPPSRSQPRRSANAVQDTAIHLLQSFARSAHALFAKRPVHVRTRRASLSFDLDTEYQDTTFSPRRQPIALSGRLPTDVTEASAAGTHSHRTSLDDSSSGLTLNVSEVQARTIAVAQGRPKSEDTDTLSGSASGRSESGEGEELQFGYSADVESSQEEEQGVATGDSVLLITRARAIMEAEESRRTAVDRRSLEVVPPTPRDGNDDSYHSRYSNPTMPPLPSLPQATFVPPPRRVSEKEKAPKYRTRPPPALPRLPPSDPNLPSHENTPPSSKSSQEGTPSSSNLSGQPKKRESPRSPFTTARRLHLSPSVDSLSLYLPRPPKNSAATPVPQMYRSTPPPRSISTPRTAYTSGPPPNAFSAPFYNPHSPPTSFSAPFHSPHSPTTPYTPSFSPEFRNPHSPPNTSVDPSDPQLLFPASVRGAGYNPFQHSRSFSDGSILPPHSA